MRGSRRFFASLAAIGLSFPATVSAEPYQEYLSRLRDICSVDCLQPRQFQRTARKRGSADEGDMALIMDVVEVRRVGNKFELYNIDTQNNALVDVELLGSAGINTSSSNGVGGLPRGRQTARHPNVIVIEIDETAMYDLLNAGLQASGLANPDDLASEPEGGIIVGGDAEREVVAPSLAEMRSYFRNRRVVVRGQPRLEAVFIGARRDFRRKQVTLEVDNAGFVALLPRYDKNGEPVLGK
jgi:hypothetical protein